MVAFAVILDTARNNFANYIKLVSHSPHDVNTVLGGFQLPTSLRSEKE
jgi:hypothetical protein